MKVAANAIALPCFVAAIGLLPAEAAPKPNAKAAMPRWERPVPKGEAAAIRTLRDYAACMAVVAEAPQWFRTTPGTAEAAAVVKVLLRPRKQCRLTGRLSLQLYLLRGAIAELLYPAEARRRGALSPASPPETFDAFTARLTGADRDGLDAVDRKILVWRWMAYCAVHRDPAGAAALVGSLSSNPAEVAAVRGLRPALENCLPQQHWAELRAVAIRALVAEALFERLLASALP